MEGMLYEVDVHTLEVTKLFHKPVPGWHGKGGYTAPGAARRGQQRRSMPRATTSELTRRRAGTRLPTRPACWPSGTARSWRIIERRQFRDVTGPGRHLRARRTIRSPAVGHRLGPPLAAPEIAGRRPVVHLPAAQGQLTTTIRTHGWYTEWPRIREIGRRAG